MIVDALPRTTMSQRWCGGQRWIEEVENFSGKENNSFRIPYGNASEGSRCPFDTAHRSVS